MNLGSKLGQIISQFWGAICFLTRLPTPRLDPFPTFGACAWAFPVIGALLGAIMGLIYGGAALFLPHLAAGFLALATIAVITGGLHEDGLADTCDGLWGGHNPERRLEIMKDSRSGSFGVLAIVFYAGLSASLLADMGGEQAVMLLAALGAISRTGAVLMLKTSPMARPDGLGQAAASALEWGQVIPALALALGITLAISLMGLGNLGAALVLMGLVLLWAMGLLARRKINGVTGDICGAYVLVMQICGLMLWHLWQVL